MKDAVMSILLKRVYCAFLLLCSFELRPEPAGPKKHAAAESRAYDSAAKRAKQGSAPQPRTASVAASVCGLFPEPPSSGVRGVGWLEHHFMPIGSRLHSSRCHRSSLLTESILWNAASAFELVPGNAQALFRNVHCNGRRG